MKFIDKLKFASVCGIDCESECTLYRAYQDDDLPVRRELAIKLLGDADRWPEIRCDGCKGEQAICWRMQCAVKMCASKHGYEFCYECNNYPCSQLVTTQETNRKLRTFDYLAFPGQVIAS